MSHHLVDKISLFCVYTVYAIHIPYVYTKPTHLPFLSISALIHSIICISHILNHIHLSSDIMHTQYSVQIAYTVYLSYTLLSSRVKVMNRFSIHFIVPLTQWEQVFMHEICRPFLTKIRIK